MNINNFSVDLRNGVLIVTKREGVTKDEAWEMKVAFEESTGHVYNYLMWNDSLGYFHAYDFLKEYSIYCTSLNKVYAVELVNKYIKDGTKN